MKPPRTARRIMIVTLVEVALLATLHHLLLHLLARSSTAATLLSAGPHAPLDDILLAVAFVAIRLLVILLLPGFVLYRLTRAAFAFRRDHGSSSGGPVLGSGG